MDQVSSGDRVGCGRRRPDRGTRSRRTSRPCVPSWRRPSRACGSSGRVVIVGPQPRRRQRFRAGCGSARARGHHPVDRQGAAGRGDRQPRPRRRRGRRQRRRRRCGSCCPAARHTSTVRSSGSVRGRAHGTSRLGAAAGRQGRRGHRRGPRHRCRRSPTSWRATAPPWSCVDIPAAGDSLAADRQPGRRHRPPARRHRGRRRAADPRPRRPAATAASTSSCTTPASPATSCSPTWTRRAGRRCSTSTSGRSCG